MQEKINVRKIVLAVVLITLVIGWKGFKQGVIDGWNSTMEATK